MAAEGVALLTVSDVKRHDLVIPLADYRQKHKVDLRIHMVHGEGSTAITESKEEKTIKIEPASSACL